MSSPAAEGLVGGAVAGPVPDVATCWEGREGKGWASLWGVPHLEIHRRLPSTQDRARTLALAGAPAFTMVIADEQTEGRGRSGKRWVSAPGRGLWCSFVLGKPGAAYVPLVVGLAVARAIERVVPAAGPVRIEWPNDVTIDDRKVAGVLCEAAASGLIAGVGVNMRAPAGGFAPDLEARAGALEDWDPEAGRSRSALAGALVDTLRARWGEATGRVLSPELTAELEGRDALHGRRVSSEQEGMVRALGITTRGTLLVQREDGSRVEVHSGRVRPLLVHD